MKDIVIEKSLNLLNRSYQYDSDTFDRVRYGLEVIYISITKLIVILGFSIVFGLVKETLLTIVLFNGLRTYAYGIHAKKSSHCYISSTLIFVFLPWIFKYIEFSIIQKVLISIISIVGFYLFAPADTHKRPLINKKHRNKLKRNTLLVCCLYIIIILISDNILLNNLIILSMILELFVVNPWTYKLFDMPYNNYLAYQSK